MILVPGEFRTLTGDLWRAHLEAMRARRETRGVLACKHASCPVRTSCGRFSESAEFSATWPGGTNCHGFQPSTVQSPAAA